MGTGAKISCASNYEAFVDITQLNEKCYYCLLQVTIIKRIRRSALKLETAIILVIRNSKKITH
jgi:hypothetical protein